MFLFAVVAATAAVVVGAALVDVAPVPSSALGGSPSPAATPASAPPAWLLADISQMARNCGDPHAQAWWTLTTARRAVVVEGEDAPANVADPDRPVYVSIIHGDLTRWLWSLISEDSAPDYSWVVQLIDARSHIADMVATSARRFDTAGLALQSVSLPAPPNPTPAATPPPADVIGSVLLQTADGERAGAGLTVMARSERSGRRPSTARTAADGSFRLALEPGWYLLTVDAWGEPALQVCVPRLGVAFAPIGGPSEELAAMRTVEVNDVPSVLPRRGVRVGPHVLLQPPPAHLPPVVGTARAIHIARGSGSVRALLAMASDPSRVLGRGRRLLDRLTWVVVRDLPRPVDAAIGAYRPGATRTPGLMVHSVSLIDARSGRFLEGFFTR